MLVGVLILSGMSALLALLLEVARALIADYGDCRILVNREKELVVKGGSPLLFSLAEEGIFIPSGCGGKGTCSLCKVQVIDGGGPLLPTETPYLDPKELEGGVRLSCQIKVRNDMEIRIPEALFRVREFKVRVARIDQLARDIKGVRFTVLSPEEGIRFTPGQYLQLRIPKYRRSKETEYRAYSISSSASSQREVELVITRAPEGIVSTYIHDFLNEGDELFITGPYGEFYLRESNRDILLIATGSGLAPIKSILHQIEEEKLDRNTTLFFGEKTPDDLYYVDRLREFEKTIPRFTFIPTLSRTTEGNSWGGERGRVTDLIRKLVSHEADLDAYICGSPVMVQSCVDLLRERGIPPERIFYDKFD